MEVTEMRQKLNMWMSKNKDDAHLVGLAIKNIHPEFMQIEAAGCNFQVSMPLTFEDEDSAFFATPLEDEDLDTISLLNDRLERVRTTPDCLHRVLDNILLIFQKYQLGQPHLSRLIHNASVQFQKADQLDGILPWCRISLNRNSEAVDIEMDMRGIMGGHNLVAALGFRFDEPLLVQLQFDPHLLREREVSLDSLLKAIVAVKQKSSTSRGIRKSIENAVRGMDEGIVDTITKCFPSSEMREHGPSVLVPQLINDFFGNCRMEPDGFLHVKGMNSNSDNIFIALSTFLGSQLKSLRNLCVMCRKHLPEFSILWFCDEELCLFRIEELGIGASVLQKLQNTEVMEFEISLAASAANSDSDVFEPYPNFLLKGEEVRKRSGFFSEYTPDISTTNPRRDQAHKYLPNKDLNTLKQVINSFPLLSEMQQCSDELELIVKLGVSWLQQNGSFDASVTCQVDDYRRKIRIPYKVLSYLLFTNRLSLHLLRDHHKLNVEGNLYQFAVIYDAQREENFEERRKKEGSIFAFHGSKTSNWYSIIRNGLRCLSKTKYMTAMVYGAGIYLSSDINVSLAYTGYTSFSGNDRTKALRVMALCEVFSGQTKQYMSTGKIIVVPPQYEKDVVIRYLIAFAFDDVKCPYDVGATVEQGHLFMDKQRKSTNLYEHYNRARSQYMEELENASLFPTAEHLDDFRKRRPPANLSL